MPDAVSMLFAGDCGPAHGPAEGVPLARYTELVRPVLAEADLRFVNCMRAYSARGIRMAHAPQACQPPEMAAIFSDGLFDAVCLANNHSCDAGLEAMLDTRALFHGRGIAAAGAGRDLAEARSPAILERRGVRVGYLCRTSLGRPEDAAGDDRPGIARLRIETTYETRGPHRPVRVRTTPHPEDLALLAADVAALRRQVDVVVLAFHAGITWLPRMIPDYQVAVAHAAVEAGADLVIGHAPHLPKAIEVYQGRTIFYSLGVFAMTKPFAAPAWQEPAWAHGAVRNHNDLDPGFPLMPYGRGTSLSLLARLQVAPGGRPRVSFLPMAIDALYRPEVLRCRDDRFDEVVRYLDWASQDMPHAFRVEGDEVVVTEP